jgi:hypothetical protein
LFSANTLESGPEIVTKGPRRPSSEGVRVSTQDLETDSHRNKIALTASTDCHFLRASAGFLWRLLGGFKEKGGLLAPGVPVAGASATIPALFGRGNMAYQKHILEWCDITRTPRSDGTYRSRWQLFVAWLKRAILVCGLIWLLVRLCVALVRDINEQARYGVESSVLEPR